MKRAALRGALATLAALLALELALHLAPALLPRAYLAGFPGNGTEFFHPDVFERTPVEGVLLPHRTTPHRGPPPADLVELGLAPPGAGSDRRAFPEVELPADELGLPNARTRPRADLVLVGDSIGVAAGTLRPEGLQAALERASGLALYNASLAGIGPVQERWLLEQVGLPLAPRAVLWLYFSGNDLTESYDPLLQRRAGKTTWAEAYPERRRPFLLLPGVLASLLRAPRAPRCPAPLAPFLFPRAGGGEEPVWFHPDYLRQLGWTAEEWRAHPVWNAVQDELRSARDVTSACGATLVLVYVPSKPEVLLSSVRRDPELALRTITALGGAPPPGTAEEVFEALLSHRHDQETVVREFCDAEWIPFFSATPHLEEQARRGELGYLATDTHWQSTGQAVLVEPLLEFLREQGILQ